MSNNYQQISNVNGPKKEYMEYRSIIDREDLMDGEIGEMGDYSVVELLVEQAEVRKVTSRAFAWGKQPKPSRQAADVVVLNKTDLASEDRVPGQFGDLFWQN